MSTTSQGDLQTKTLRTVVSQSPSKPAEVTQSIEDPSEIRDTDDESMGSVPSEEANIELDVYPPVVGVDEEMSYDEPDENSLDEQSAPMGESRLQTSIQTSMMRSNRNLARDHHQSHVGGWGGGMESGANNRSNLLGVSSPDLYHDHSRHMTGHVEEVEDDKHSRSRYLDKRREMAKEHRISVSVEPRGSEKSFQEMNILKMMDQSRRSSQDPSERYSPRSNRRLSGISILKNSGTGPMKLRKQPTDHFTMVFRRAGLDSRLLQQRLMNASKVDMNVTQYDLPAVGES